MAVFYTLSPVPKLQFFDPLTSQPLNGGWLKWYRSGLGSLATVYKDSAGAAQWANPMQLDSSGRAVVYLDALSYAVEVYRNNNGAPGALIDTIDPVSSVAVSQSLITDIIPLGGAPSLGTTDAAYPAGATLDKILFGSNSPSFDSGSLVGTWALRAMLRSDDGASTVTLGLMNLSDGAPNTALVEITSTSAVGQFVTSGTITFPAAGAAKSYGLKLKVAAGFGQAWDAQLVRTA